jgi:serine/threonine-protein kinase
MQGQTLDSRYRIIEYIAKGGFGKTYLAEDTQLPAKDKCVVKQLYLSVDDPNFIKIARRLFKTEAETLHNLGTHDQIPRLLAYFEEDEKFYLVQQYIEGHTLTQELEEGKPWTEARVIELLRDCLNILNFVHSKNVIHRDVKPDNLIRRNSDGKLVLVDFGTVKEIIAEQTQLVPATVAVGTRGYMPTEQARGKPRTTSDIYALGVIAIQALTGTHPIKLPENNNGELVWQDKASCGPQLKEIVAKMTRYHFKERYQNAEEITAALSGIGTNQGNISQTEAAKYSPTVQLSGTQIANMAGKPRTRAQIAKEASVLATPQNPTNFSAALPSELLSVNPQQLESAEPSLIEPEANSMPNTQKSHKTLITLGAAIAIGAIATGGMYFFNQQSTKTAKANLEGQIADLNQKIEQQDYQACYDEAIKIKTQANSGDENIVMPAEQQQEFEVQCGLALAQAAATDLDYGEALELAKTLPRNTSFDGEIQQQTDAWSTQLLQQATQVYQRQGNLEEAIEIVKQIPQDSAVRPQAIDAKEAWKTEAKQNESIIFAANKALSEEKWQYAKQEATKVQNSSPSIYWQDRAKAIIKQAEEGLTATAAKPDSKPATAIDPVRLSPKVETVVTPKPAEPVAPAKTIAPKQPPKTITTPPTPSEELRDLSEDSNVLRDLESNPPSNERLRDL